MPRQARLDSPGTLHHVIIRGINKRRIVDDEEDRKDFVRRMGTLAEETLTGIYAWALMTVRWPRPAEEQFRSDSRRAIIFCPEHLWSTAPPRVGRPFSSI